jgi:hypothetical protein
MMKNYKDTYQNTLIASGNNIKELQRLTLINILKSKGIIYRHYQLKFQKKRQSNQEYLPTL